MRICRRFFHPVFSSKQVAAIVIIGTLPSFLGLVLCLTLTHIHIGVLMVLFSNIVFFAANYCSSRWDNNPLYDNQLQCAEQMIFIKEIQTCICTVNKRQLSLARFNSNIRNFFYWHRISYLDPPYVVLQLCDLAFSTIDETMIVKPQLNCFLPQNLSFIVLDYLTNYDLAQKEHLPRHSLQILQYCKDELDDVENCLKQIMDVL